MGKYAATAMGRALELCEGDPVMHNMADSAHYVLDKTLLELFERADVVQCVYAMVQADLGHLPVSPMLVEFELDGVRRFVQLEEHREANRFSARVATMKGPALTVTTLPLYLEIVSYGVFLDGRTSEADGSAAVLALYTALLMLHTKGIDKEVIDVTRLNKARGEAGKPRIPGHTLMRIGSYYDKNGTRHGISKGRTIPLHLRIGHARHQAHGPARTERKWIFIPPVVVNYKDADELQSIKQPKKILAR